MADVPDPNPIALSLPWRQDLQLTDNGSLVFCSGTERLRQRVIRRFFTAPTMVLADGTYVPADYVFDTAYGFGANRLVGEPMSDDVAAKMKQKLRKTIMVDEGVDTTQLPIISLFATQMGQVWASVKVFLLDNGIPDAFVINFPVLENNSV